MYPESSNRRPNLVENRSNMAPKWLPNGSPEASGRPWGAEVDLERFWGPFWHPFWLQKSSKIEPKFSRKSSTGFGRHFWPTGSLLGPFWGRFGVYFGVFFRSSAYRFPPDRPKSSTTYFWRFRLLREVQKTMKNVSGSSVRQEACSKSVLGGSRARFGSILSSILDPKIDPKAN